MFVSPPNSYVEIVMPNVTVLGGGPLEGNLGHEDRALGNEINALIKEAQENSLGPSTCEDAA